MRTLSRAAVLVLALVTACSFVHGRLPGDGGSEDTGTGEGGTGSDAGSGSNAGSDASPSPLRAKTITIIALTGPHTDFPLWVTLTDSDLAARARPDGSDIHFVAGGTLLDYEIQSWTKSTGRLDVWVRVPTLVTGTQIELRYGDVTAAHAPDPAGTFSGYKAVWHLEDPLTNNTVADSRNVANGTASNLNASDSVTAKLGKGIDFRGGADQVTFTNPLSGNTAHTISMWIDQRATSDNDAIIVLGNGSYNQARWFHSRYNSATIAVGFYSNDYTPDENVIGDGWVLLHWVFEGPSRNTRIYRDGLQVGQTHQHAMGINTQGTAGYLGNAPAAFGSNMGLNATLDEVRIIDVARSAGWIAAEALNQTSPLLFYSVSTEQVP